MTDILVTTENSVMTITINRVAKKNSILPSMYADMVTALADAAINPAVRVVVFQGDETAFSAGNDLGDFDQSPDQTEESPVRRFIVDIATFPKPVIAAVNGVAAGIGTTMLLHCDLVYAGANAKFILPFTSLGLCPEAGSSRLLVDRIGHVRAAELFFFAEPFGPEEALRAGLINRVLDQEEVKDFAHKQAVRLVARPLQAIRETKRLLKRGRTPAILDQIAEENAVFEQLLLTPTAKEAFAAFFEKREPDFQGLPE